MSNIIETLVVKIASDITHFEQGISNALKGSAQFEQSINKIGNLGEGINKIGKSIDDVGTKLTTRVSAPLTALMGLVANASIAFESAFAGVRKTVNATEEQFQALEAGIRSMSKEIPASANEIAEVAEAAGQLGIETDAILGFTKVMVNLGVATNMSATDAATSLARFANITNMSQHDFDKLGSSIVDLGNNFATTEGEIVDMAMRLAGAGAQVGMTQGDILGLATALTSVGVQAEMGGSAMSKVMVNMQAASASSSSLKDILDRTGLSLRELELMAANDGKSFTDLASNLSMTKNELNSLLKSGVNLQNFGKIAGMTAEEFKKAFEEDAAGALQSFIMGLGGAEAAGDSAIVMLQEMGITEVRLRDALLRASNANELFNEAIKTGNEAWAENVALTNEAEQRYKTTASQMQIFKNKLYDLGITLGGLVVPWIIKFMDAIEPWIEKFANLEESTQGTILKLGALAIAAGPVLKVIGSITSGVGSMISIFSKISALAPLIAKIGPALSALTGPVGIVIGVVAALVAVFTGLYNTNEEFRVKVQEIWAEIQAFLMAVFMAIQDGAIAIFNGLKDFWNTWGDDIIAFFQNMWESIKNAFSTLGKGIVEAAKAIFNGLKEFWNTWGAEITAAFMGVFNALKDLVTTVFQGIWEIIKSIFDSIKAFWDEWGSVIIEVFKAAFEMIKTLVEDVFNGLKKFWDTWGSTITAAFVAVWKLICNAFETALNLLKNLFNIFVGVFTGDWNKVWNSVKGIFETIWNGIKSAFNTVLNAILNIARDIFERMRSTVSEKMESVRSAISSILDNIRNMFAELPGRAIEWGRNLISGFVDGIRSASSWVGDAVSNVMGNVADFIGFNSPSKKGEGRNIVRWGYNMIHGFLDGVDDSIPLVNQMMNRVIPNMDNAINSISVSGNSNIRAQAAAIPQYAGNAGGNKTEITINTEGLFKGAILTVREDSDIEKIVKLVLDRLADYLLRKNRMAGLQSV